MFNLINADIYKLHKSKSMKIIIAASIICASMVPVFSYYIAAGTIDSGVSGSIFLFSDASVMGLLGSLMIGNVICGDLKDKTIHNAIVCGTGRLSILVSKLMILLLISFCVILPYMVVTGIAASGSLEFSLSTGGVGFLNILLSESGRAVSSEMMPKLVSIIIIQGLVYLGQLSICLPLSFLFKRSSLVFFCFYALSFLSGQLSSLYGKSIVFDNIYAGIPFGAMHSLLTLESTANEMGKAAVVSILFIVIMGIITYHMFKKTEIK